MTTKTSPPPRAKKSPVPKLLQTQVKLFDLEVTEAHND